MSAVRYTPPVDSGMSVQRILGSTLPETGGAGTYLLYAAGVAVVITDSIMITARKKADEK